MKGISHLLFAALLGFVGFSAAFAQDAAAPIRHSSPEESGSPAATVSPSPSATPEQTPAVARPEASAGTASPAPAAIPTPGKSPVSRRARVLREKPVRAAEPRAPWTRRRPWDDPPGLRSPSRPTFGLSGRGDRTIGAAIRRLERAWQAAVKQRDASAVKELLADDFVDTSASGRVGSKSSLLRETRHDKNVYKTAEVSSLSVRTESDNVAVVTGLARESGVDGKKRFTSSRRFTDTWVKRNGKWLCIARQATHISKQ